MIAEDVRSPTETETVCNQEPTPCAEKDESDPGATGQRRPGVLVVDDDLGVRTLLEIVLRQHGFAVWLTEDGYQAMHKYRGRRDDIDLVLLDVRMPELDGPQTLAALQQLDPRIRCCFMTADVGRYTEQELMERGAERIIYKPFRVDEVVQILRGLVGAAAPESSIDLPGGGRTHRALADVSTDWQLFAGGLR